MVDSRLLMPVAGGKSYLHDECLETGGSALELVPSLDEEESVLWKPYGVSYRGYSCSSVMSWFSRIEPQNYALGPHDLRTLSYLSATSAVWLPVLTYDGLRFTSYCTHKVRKQFKFDQEVPITVEVVADVLPTTNPFIKSRAFHYWSNTTSELVIPSGERAGIYTMGMNHYWQDLMTSMLEFRNGGNESIEHLLHLYKAPSLNLQLFVATNTVTTYARKQGLGYVVWHSDLSKWMTYSKRHTSAWLKANPNNIPALEKVASKRGKRVTAAASSSKKKKSVAKVKKSASKGIVIREPVAKTPQPEEQATPRGFSSKKTVRKC